MILRRQIGISRLQPLDHQTQSRTENDQYFETPPDEHIEAYQAKCDVPSPRKTKGARGIFNRNFLKVAEEFLKP